MSAPSASFPTSIQQRTDRWFSRASAALLGQVPCRAGCFHCCLGPFPITLLDVRTLQAGLARLPLSVRQTIEATADEQVSAMEAAYPRLGSSPFLDAWPDADIDAVVEQFRALPCPALDDEGLCRVYEYRPLTCRSMGLPTREGSLIQGACDVQTFVPISRLSEAIQEDERRLAQEESLALATMRSTTSAEGEEVLISYGFKKIMRLDHE